MKKLDDESLAKGDIVSRPEITNGVEPVKAQEKTASESVQSETEPQDVERAERQSRIFARRLERFMKGMTGDDVSQDEAAEIAEIGGMIFKGLLKVPFGNVIGGTIVAVCLAIPFMPRLVKYATKKPEEKTQ